MLGSPFTVPDVKPGDNIARAYQAFAREEEAWRIQGSPTMRRFRTPRGTTLNIDAVSQVYLTPWLASFAVGGAVSLRPGRVNGLTPTINGQPMTVQGITLPLAGVAPNAAGETTICVQVERDPATGLISTKVPYPVQIIHVTDVDTYYRDGGSVVTNNLGRSPLAVIVWNGNTPVRIDQNEDGNLKWEFLKPATGNRGRHFFT